MLLTIENATNPKSDDAGQRHPSIRGIQIIPLTFFNLSKSNDQRDKQQYPS